MKVQGKCDIALHSFFLSEMAVLSLKESRLFCEVRQDNYSDITGHDLTASWSRLV